MNSIYSTKPWVTKYQYSGELPIPAWSMIDAFERSAANLPLAPAIYYFDEIISFGDLENRASRFAALLASWGIGKGDRVAVSLQNDPEFAVAQLGSWKRGAILVPLNPMFKEKEISYHLADSGAKIWIALHPAYTDLALAAGVERVIDAEDLAGLLAAQAPGHQRVPVPAEDIALLVYTSGTTGPPKGAMI